MYYYVLLVRGALVRTTSTSRTSSRGTTSGHISIVSHIVSYSYSWVLVLRKSGTKMTRRVDFFLKRQADLFLLKKVCTNYCTLCEFTTSIPDDRGATCTRHTIEGGSLGRTPAPAVW